MMDINDIKKDKIKDKDYKNKLIKNKKYEITKRTLQNIGIIFIGIILFIVIPLVGFKNFSLPLIFAFLCIIAICCIIRSFLDLDDELNKRFRLKTVSEDEGIPITVTSINDNHEIKTMYIMNDKVYTDTLYDYDILPISFIQKNADKISIQINDDLDIIVTL